MKIIATNRKIINFIVYKILSVEFEKTASNRKYIGAEVKKLSVKKSMNLPNGIFLYLEIKNSIIGAIEIAAVSSRFRPIFSEYIKIHVKKNIINA